MCFIKNKVDFRYFDNIAREFELFDDFYKIFPLSQHNFL